MFGNPDVLRFQLPSSLTIGHAGGTDGIWSLTASKGPYLLGGSVRFKGGKYVLCFSFFNCKIKAEEFMKKKNRLLNYLSITENYNTEGHSKL